jgi:hypothetical protein
MKNINLIVISLLFSTFCLHAQTISNDKIISYYSLDGNADDISGNGRNCVVNGAVLSTGVDGKPNSCYDVTDGSLNYEGSFPLSDSVLTFSAWIQPSAYQSTSIFACKIKFFEDISFNLWQGAADWNDINSYYFYPVCSVKTSISDWEIVWISDEDVLDVKPNDWMHYFVSFEMDTVSIFINNQEIYRDVSSNYFIEEELNYPSMRIGHDFVGKIDEVYLIAATLSEADRTLLYNFGASSVTGSKEIVTPFSPRIKYSENEIELLLANEFTGNLTLLDINGKILRKESLNKINNWKFNVDDLSAGTYFISLNGSELNTSVKVMLTK